MFEHATQCYSFNKYTDDKVINNGTINHHNNRPLGATYRRRYVMPLGGKKPT